jgi:integrase
MDERCVPIFRFMCQYGCRPGEAIVLQWSDIHDNTIYLRIPKTAKSGVRVNELPIINGILPERKSISSTVFLNSKRRPFSLRVLQESLTRALVKSEMKLVKLLNI